jgi:TadE-like protein
MKRYTNNNSERGTATVEFALTAAFFLMMIMAIVSGGHLFFTHNAMVESTRRGARYAAFLAKPPTACDDPATVPVKNMVLYGTPTAGTTPLVNNLQTANVSVCYSEDYGVAQGTVTVKIVNYSYTFAVAGRVINMPQYQTTVTGESAGAVPGVTCP